MSSLIITQLLVVLRTMKYHFLMFNTTECLNKKRKGINSQQSSIGVVTLFHCSATFQLCVQRYYRSNYYCTSRVASVLKRSESVAKYSYQIND